MRLDRDGSPGKLHHRIHKVHAPGEFLAAERGHPEGDLLALLELDWRSARAPGTTTRCGDTVWSDTSRVSVVT